MPPRLSGAGLFRTVWAAPVHSAPSGRRDTIPPCAACDVIRRAGPQALPDIRHGHGLGLTRIYACDRHSWHTIW
jgi:hypothetical protein